VANAAFFDYGKGTATGMAPRARIAAYKVCYTRGCSTSDILKAFDEAIKDRVNVISVSLGFAGESPPFHSDNTAVGAFSAVRKGIVVSASAGNSGPGEYTVTNTAPWLLTVGASTINRQFPANVVLGSGETFTGTSLYAGTPLGPSKLPLVYGGDVGSSVCEAGKLIASSVAGKIVVCDPGVNGGVAKGEAVKLAGGAGAILGNYEVYGEQSSTTPHVHPVTDVTFAAAEKIKRYIRTSASPVATILFLGTVVGGTPSSPRMASFSSRGPNLLAPEILKPDVTAPRVDILAAWTGENSPSQLDSDTRRVKFVIISGTSMSCPHVSGIAALLRQARPDWSPAAIKSALMTTAYNVDNAGDIIRTYPPARRPRRSCAGPATWIRTAPSTQVWCTTPAPTTTSLSCARSATPPARSPS
jgi:subtilisin family serine protease